MIQAGTDIRMIRESAIRGRYMKKSVRRSHVPSRSIQVPLYCSLSDMMNRMKKRRAKRKTVRYEAPSMKCLSSNIAADLRRGKNSNAMKPMADE